MATQIKKTGTGQFDIIKDGKVIGEIINGSTGFSGYGKNHYGIVWATGTGKTVRVGSLASAKKLALQA